MRKPTVRYKRQNHNVKAFVKGTDGRSRFLGEFLYPPPTLKIRQIAKQRECDITLVMPNGIARTIAWKDTSSITKPTGRRTRRSKKKRRGL